MSDQTEMKIGVFVQDVGHHIASWRHPDVPADGGTSFDHYRHLAAVAERGKLDALFFGDMVTIMYPEDEYLGQTARTVHLEPMTLLPALAMVTTHIGLISTASTSYNEPYHIARKFATLDHISGGRAGWNIVTSWTQGEALNFNLDDVIDHGLRYRRAHEFVDVVKGLWDTFEDDAFLRDKKTGTFFDPAKLHALHHRGEHFSVRGPLNINRSPQGYPVLVQAGSSDDGQDLAASTAEVVFTAQTELSDAQAFYATLKSKVEQYGRAPSDIKIMPGIMPVVGRTEEEALEKFQRFQELIPRDIGWSIMKRHLGGADLSSLSFDGPVPETLPQTQGNQSRLKLLLDLSKRNNWTVRQLYWRVVGSRGHWLAIGTPKQIADQMEERFRNSGADGFNIMPPWLPGGLEEFVDHVVPELQHRGLFRREYRGLTLRDHLGLARPSNRNLRDGLSERTNPHQPASH